MPIRPNNPARITLDSAPFTHQRFKSVVRAEKILAPKPESKHHCNAWRCQKRNLPRATPSKITALNCKAPLQFGFGTTPRLRPRGKIQPVA